jgi:hypothetical protein
MLSSPFGSAVELCTPEQEGIKTIRRSKLEKIFMALHVADRLNEALPSEELTALKYAFL